ncbi:MAG: nitroreductase family protein [Clostridiaceae bacterium]|nr:nitroreductase family protein [Clostridiaceae bacterium]
MEFYEVVESRRTIRDFENVDIDDAVIERIISAAMKAPSNDHMRDWHFIVIKDKEVVLKLVDKIPKKVSQKSISGVLKNWNLNDPCQQNVYKDAIPKQYRMFAEASCVVIPLLKQKTDILQPDNLSHLNGFASIWCSIENLLLAATAEGYAATLRIPLGNEGEWARTVLRFPDDYLMPCFIAIGKASPNAPQLKQIEHPLEKVIHRDSW